MTPAPVRGRSASLAVFLSFLWPGLGQAYQRRRRPALIYALPVVAMAAVAGFALLTRSLQGLALDLFDASYAQTILIVGVLLGVWRLVSMADAWRWDRRAGLPSRLAGGILAVLAVAVIGVHGGIGYYTWAFLDASPNIFVGGDGNTSGPTADPGSSPGQTPAASPTDDLAIGSPLATPATTDSRITVLLAGIDSSPTRSHALSDTLLVVSVDPVAKTAAMLSVPRDLSQLPLWNGGTYAGKINSFLTYAQQNPKQFPDGPASSLVKELSYLIGTPIHYYATVNLGGFVTLINLVGGVTVNNQRAIADPVYGGWTDKRPIGFYLPAGKQFLDGQSALAYVRSRMGAGDNDFTRARRQQDLLVALEKKLTDPAMLPKLPQLLAAAGNTVKTNFPAARLSDVLDMARSINDANITKIVLGPPYSEVPSVSNGTYMLVPDMTQFRNMSIRLFGADSRFSTSGLGQASPAPSTGP
jgi:LCP family protein required for cell wall assembly